MSSSPLYIHMDPHRLKLPEKHPNLASANNLAACNTFYRPSVLPSEALPTMYVWMHLPKRWNQNTSPLFGTMTSTKMRFKVGSYCDLYRLQISLDKLHQRTESRGYPRWVIHGTVIIHG